MQLRCVNIVKRLAISSWAVARRDARHKANVSARKSVLLFGISNFEFQIFKNVGRIEQLRGMDFVMPKVKCQKEQNAD